MSVCLKVVESHENSFIAGTESYNEQVGRNLAEKAEICTLSKAALFGLPITKVNSEADEVGIIEREIIKHGVC